MYCFNKTRRLLTKKDFEFVFQQADKLITSEFVVLTRKNSCSHARIGFAFSKKVINKAHDRNRLKRLFRESFRLTSLPTIDIVILAKKNIQQIENKILLDKINRIWMKLTKLCEK